MGVPVLGVPARPGSCRGPCPGCADKARAIKGFLSWVCQQGEGHEGVPVLGVPARPGSCRVPRPGCAGDARALQGFLGGEQPALRPQGPPSHGLPLWLLEAAAGMGLGLSTQWEGEA